MDPRRRRRLLIAAAVVVVVVLVCPAIAWSRALLSRGDAFVSLPPSGAGFRTSSTLVGAMGRQYVRHEVAAALTTALADVAGSNRVFVVADTGHKDGGPFPPHATHQEGLSVDIHMPVVDAAGAPATLSSSFWNLWGYCWHLDPAGHVAGLAWEAKPLPLPLLGKTQLCPSVDIDSDDHADFDTVARLVKALDVAARAHGGRVRTVIIAPEFVAPILASPSGKALGPLSSVFTRHPVWVRHDDHLHVDFSFPRAR